MTDAFAGSAQGGHTGLTRFVRTWSAALRGTVFLALRPAERDRVLAGFAQRLADALVAERFERGEAWRVGADLVAAGFTTPDVLGPTLTTVTSRLVTDLQLQAPAQQRLGSLVDALAGGFTSAIHDRALDAQEAVRTAALTAHVRTERALRDSEARALQLATHDPVTGLPNRSVLTQRLGELTAGAGAGPRLGVCCLDLDRFAAVNDMLGFQIGDRLLMAVAGRLRALAGPAGWTVFRLEGDQFAILVEEIAGCEDAVKAADRALSTLAEPFHLDELELPLTASVGIADGGAGTIPAELIQAAQTALHWAKADGGDRWRLYCPERAASDTARYRLSAAIPRALRRGEFTLVYQPLVDLANRHLVGVEALARWRHPEHGLLPAGRFIGLAEHTGLIVPLGNQLLARACRQAAAWCPGTPDPPYVSVNIAAAQLQQPGFAGYLAQVLDHTGLPPRRLQLEITEHAIIDMDRVSATLDALAGRGIRIAIDDFGTGYSNLARLRDLPLHTLKLDTTLARQTPTTSDQDDEFLATVVGLGRACGLSVTAEGIETADQARRMYAAGCDTGQGWYLGRPQAAHRISRQLRRPPPAPSN